MKKNSVYFIVCATGKSAEEMLELIKSEFRMIRKQKFKMHQLNRIKSHN